MNTCFENSFLEDIHDSIMIENSMNTFGNVVDQLIESEINKTHLFESQEDKEWKKAITWANEELDFDHADLLDDGEMIDMMMV